jgi:hypothetical protein
MKRIAYLSIALLSLLATSCGGGKSDNSTKDAEEAVTSKTLTITQSEVYGNVDDLFEVVPGDYELKEKNDMLSISVKLRLLKSAPDGADVESYPNLKLVDGDDNNLASLFSDSNDKFDSFIKKTPGAEITIKFSTMVYDNNDLKNAIKFTLTGVEFYSDEVKVEPVVVSDVDIDQAVENIAKTTDAMSQVAKATKDMMNSVLK